MRHKFLTMMLMICSIATATTAIATLYSEFNYSGKPTMAMYRNATATRYAYYVSDGTYGVLLLNRPVANYNPHWTYQQLSLPGLHPLFGSHSLDAAYNPGDPPMLNNSGTWSENGAGQIILTPTNSRDIDKSGNITTLNVTGSGSTFTADADTVNTTTGQHWHHTMYLVEKPANLGIGDALTGDRQLQYMTATHTGSIYCYANGTYSAPAEFGVAGTWKILDSRTLQMTTMTGVNGIVFTFTLAERFAGGFHGAYSKKLLDPTIPSPNFGETKINLIVF